MQRELQGRYETVTYGDERVAAFVPAPLPPAPSLEFSALQAPLGAATLALGRLDGLASSLPDCGLFLYSYVRKEAVLSSRIEGTRSSLHDLMRYELGETPGVPVDDATEVARCVTALERGRDLLASGLPVSSRLIRHVHETLMTGPHGIAKDPGEFRRSQNWIGGTRPGNARFVPPPPLYIPDCMGALEQFIHAENDGIPPLIRAGLTHAQFETIHPFLDGNGRAGRLLITLMLLEAGLLRAPLLYLSLFFKQHRARYYDLLDGIRRNGDWEAWLLFFLEGVETTAIDACDMAQRLAAMFTEHRVMIEALGRRGRSALDVHDALKSRPVTTLRAVAEATGLSFPAVGSAMELLIEHAIVRETTGKRRGRVFVYAPYLDILNEGTDDHV